MNNNIGPIERRLLYFEYENKSDHKYEINWLGFDKYKFLVYRI